jgi:hypothetical protein
VLCYLPLFEPAFLGAGFSLSSNLKSWLLVSFADTRQN